MANSGRISWRFIWLFKCMLGPLVFMTIAKSVAGQAIVCGFVKNEKGKPIAFASVTAGNDSTKPASLFAITNAEGFFRISIPNPSQTFFLTITHLQFQEKKMVLAVGQLSGDCPDIVLNQHAGTLSPVVVKVERPVTIRGDTIVFNTRSFSNGTERSILELVGKLPGITVLEDGKLLFNGQLIEHLLFEGEDMSGRNYMDIIKNIGPTGIEQIELINDYTDISDIGAGFFFTEKKALNLRFGKDRLSRLFGQVGVAVGLPVATYSADNNTMFLGKKTKLVAFGNANATGDLKVYKASGEGVVSQETGTAELTLPSLKSLAIMENPMSNPLNHEQISENTSGIANGYLKFIPGKKTRIHMGIRYADDRHQQTGSSVTTFALPPVISRSRILNDMNRLLDFNINGNMQFNSRNQLILLTRKSIFKTQRDESLRLLNREYTNNFAGSENQEGARAIWNHLTKRDDLLRADVQYSNGRLPLLIQQTPSNFSDFFFPGETVSSIEQEEHQQLNAWLASVSMTKRIRQYRIILKALHHLTGHKLQNDITGTYSDGNINSYDSTAQTDVLRHDSKIEIAGTTTIAERLEVTTGWALNHVHVSTHGNTPATVNKWFLLPDINLTWKLAEHTRIALNFMQKTVIGSTEQIYGGYAIRRDIHIERGAYAPRADLSSTLKLSFSSNNIPRNGRLFFMSIAFQRTPLLYLPEISNDPQFSISRLNPTDRYFGLMNFFVKLDQLISASRWRLLSDFTYTLANTASTLNGTDIENNLSNLKYTLGVKYFNKATECLLRGEFRYLGQRNTASEYRNSNTFFIMQSSVAQKISKHYWANIDARSMFLWSNQNRQNHVMILNAGINRSIAGGKWQFGLQANNILNQRTITRATLSTAYVSTERFDLFPRYIHASLRYRF